MKRNGTLTAPVMTEHAKLTSDRNAPKRPTVNESRGYAVRKMSEPNGNAVRLARRLIGCVVRNGAGQNGNGEKLRNVETATRDFQ